MPPNPDPERFVAVLSPALRQAAAIARALEGRVQNRPKSEEPSAVKQALTIADTASQEALLTPLLEHFPGVRLEAEEDTPTATRFAKSGDALVVIDPIDGTLHSYLGTRGPYAIMIGLAIRERYVAALVALPREGLFFAATAGGGAWSARAGAAPRRARLTEKGGRVLVSHGMPRSVLDELRGAGIESVDASGGAVAIAPLIAGVRAGLRYAPGPDGVSIRGRVGALIAREAGARVLGARGEPFPADLYTPAPALLVARADADLQLLDGILDRGGLP